MAIIIDSVTLTAWESIVRLMAPHLPGCLDQIMEDGARDAARRFFKDSKVWRERDKTLATTVIGTRTYVVSGIPGSAQISDVHVAFANGLEVSIGQAGDEDNQLGTETDSTWVVTADPPDSIMLTPAPDTAGIVIKGTLSYTCSNNATGIPTKVFDLWGRDIAAGAVAELQAQPSKPWSNPGVVGDNRRKFQDAVDSASMMGGPINRISLRTRGWN